MNRLKTTDNGKLPIVSDDLRFIDAGIREAFKGAFSALGITATDSFKISGCVVTSIGLTHTWTDGVICLAGEILPVVAGSVTIPSIPQVGYGLAWIYDISFDAAGLKIFENGISHDTYEVRKAKLAYVEYSVNQNGQTDYMPVNAPYIQQKLLSLMTSSEILARIISSDIVSKINESESDWNELFLQNGWQNVGTPFANVAYKKDAFNVVYLRGMASIITVNSLAIFNLPVGFRPTHERVVGLFRIQANGDVISMSIDASVSIELSFKI
jgi:hypothetical protein